MLNSALLGGYEARSALAKANLALEVDDDWCVGGCQHWSQTEKGKERFKTLKAKYEEHQHAGTKT